ncbi:MAG: META domain-containing protein, partial [Phycisphaerales bacterium]|nr:META domain-containing protein [Phycisphaerales bacterium]
MNPTTLVALAALLLGLGGCTAAAPGERDAADLGHPPRPAIRTWNDLAGTRWQVVALGGGSLLDGSTITLEIDAGRVGGRAQNRYFADVDAGSDGVLRIGPVGATQMFNDSPRGSMDQERRYVQTLGTVNGYAIDGAALHLLRDGAVVLRLEPLPAED